eukprot:TRINITY_DN45231_c0_g1_i1.p1 TRINITY_DN45231_c0_g1~~TRINITY_DN45231_c0_g1_i1.p1  ORF type:complete len:211 (+),score=8.41 TRINITY_DN45231_c0_g1_i1:111-743(+)
MGLQDAFDDASTVAAQRETAHHGCCCKCCSLRVEIWVCFVIDITSIIGLVLETPEWYPVPARLHSVEMLQGYLVFSIFSACLIAWALFAGRRAAWPRQVLVRFMSFKLPCFIILCMGYFTISPWARPLAQWVCKYNFEQMRSSTGGDYETCVSLFPWLCTANNAIYIPAYAYSLRASYQWFRCHPDNDTRGIWGARPAAPQASADYKELP